MSSSQSAKNQQNTNKVKWSQQDTKRWIINLLKFSIWLAGLYGSCFIYIEKIYFIVSCFYFIFSNLGKRKEGEMSAYSVFNKGFKKLPGTFSAEQMFKGKTGPALFEAKEQKIMDEDQEEKAKSIDEYYKNQSKYSNRPCYCGSDLKFKKCCLPKKKQEQEDERKRRLHKPKDF